MGGTANEFSGRIFGKLLTIATNTFIETLRQPVYALIVFAALFMFFMSPSLTMYTLSEDEKLLREIGLSTLFLAGLFIAAFSASASIAEEIESQTVGTVLSKPVQRPIFVIGKFLGLGMAVTLAHYIGTIALLLTMRHGVLEAASDTHDRPVLVAVIIGAAATVLLTAFFNYCYDWKFSSTAIALLAIFSTLAVAFLSFIDRQWQYNPQNNGFAIFDVYASVLLLLAVLMLVAVAVAFSTRFNSLVTLSCCSGVFLLGLVNDYVFGQPAQTQFWARLARAIVPNLQVFWISDAVYEGSQVPFRYIAIAAVYAICYSAAALAIAVVSFQRRQVG
jgi:ABC-type Na+ efflux pump permease subunit